MSWVRLNNFAIILGTVKLHGFSNSSSLFSSIGGNLEIFENLKIYYKMWIVRNCQNMCRNC